MRNISLIIKYIGTNYHGWQKQINALSISEVIENAITDLTGVNTRITGCGRTDAGVHALGYVANFFTESKIPVYKFPSALNARLPFDIRVQSANEESLNFHSIADCIEKEYHYIFYYQSESDPFLNDRALWLKEVPDLEIMKKASNIFLGEHDFYSYHSLGTDVSSTVRTLYKCELEEKNNIIILKIRANGFLYKMARTIAGTIYYAGLHKIALDTVEKSLEVQDRSLAGPTLPAHGLYLYEALYKRG